MSSDSEFTEEMGSAGQVDSLVMKLHEIGAIKFGEFRLKSGAISPIYFDLRIVISYPRLLKSIAGIILKKAQDLGLTYDVVCGIPYTALPIATMLSSLSAVPMILKRKEAKAYGTKQMVEGIYNLGNTCLLIEDVVTTGSSVVETGAVLRAHELIITDVISILDRGQGASENLAHNGITLHSLITLPVLLSVLSREQVLSPAQFSHVSTFLGQNLTQHDLEIRKKVDSLKALVPSSNGRALLEIMLKKKSNLCISFDLDNWWEVLEGIERLAPYICLVKTHLDTYNFDNSDQAREFRRRITELSERESFLILEDRKFGDIGHTVEKQLKSKPFEVSKWVHMVTAHGLPGTGLLSCLSRFPQLSAIFIAQMSSENNLASRIPEYSREVVSMVTNEEFRSVTTGFVAQSDVSSHLLSESTDSRGWYLQFIPGVSLDPVPDSLGQQYVTVEEAIEERHGDVIIVGRGILGQRKEDQANAAEEYRKRGWESWTKRFLASS